MKIRVIFNKHRVKTRLSNIIIIITSIIFIYYVLYDIILINNSPPIGFDNILDVAVRFTLLFIFVSLLGSLVVYLLRRLNFFYNINYALSTAMGLIILPVVLPLLMIINKLLLSVLASFLIIIFVIFIRKKKNIKTRVLTIEDITFLTILTLYFVILIRLIYLVGLSPIGDLLFHNKITAQIIYRNTLFPPAAFLYINGSIPYPLIYHYTAASVSLLVSEPPIKSSIYVGALVSISLVLVIYSLVYMFTNDKLLSTIAIIFTSYVPFNILSSPWPANDLMIGNFINGTYPQHLGNLLFLLSVVFVNSLNNSDTIKISQYIVILLIMLLIIATQPRLVLITIIYITTIISYGLLVRTKRIKRSKVLVYIFFSVPIVFLLLFAKNLEDIFYVNMDMINTAISIMLKNKLHMLILIVVSIIATLISLFMPNLKKKIQNSYKNYLYSILIIGHFFIITLIPGVFERIGWLLFHWRTILLIYTLSIISIIIIIFTALKKGLMYLSLVGVALVLLFSFVNFNLHTFSNFINYGKPIGEDYNAIQTLLEYVNGNEMNLILNEPNFIGYQINGFKDVNTIFDYILDRRLRTLGYVPELYVFALAYNNDYYYEIRNNIIRVLYKENDCKSLLSLLHKLNIDYIVITSANVFLDDTGKIMRKDNNFYSNINNCLDQNLKILFTGKQARVYAIN